MPQHTLGYALERLARFNGEGGSCVDADGHLDRFNDVRNLIYERGDWEGTTEWGCVRITDCACIYLPTHLEAVRMAWISNTPVVVYGRGYQALDNVGRKACCDCSTDTKRAVQQTGIRRPITRTVKAGTSYRIAVQSEEDETVEMIFRGRDYDGNRFELKTIPKCDPTFPDKDSDDAGDLLGERIHDITEVVKPVTKGRIVVFAVLEDGTKSLIADYPAESVNPRFTQLRIRNYRTGDCKTNLVILAKKTFSRLTENDELVDIESLTALTFGYQAMNALEGNRDGEYATKIQLMEDQLVVTDTNITSPEGSVTCQPRYAQALHPAYDDGGRF